MDRYTQLQRIRKMREQDTFLVQLVVSLPSYIQRKIQKRREEVIPQEAYAEEDPSAFIPFIELSSPFALDDVSDVLGLLSRTERCIASLIFSPIHKEYESYDLLFFPVSSEELYNISHLFFQFFGQESLDYSRIHRILMCPFAYVKKGYGSFLIDAFPSSQEEFRVISLDMIHTASGRILQQIPLL